MRIRKSVTAVLFVFFLAIPAFAAGTRDRETVRERVVKSVKTVIRMLVSDLGNGLIPPHP